MKNPYQKTAKFYSKAVNLHIQRSGDYISLCDGCSAIRVHVAAYDSFFRPVSGVFVPLADGEKAYKSQDDKIASITPRGIDIEKTISDFFLKRSGSVAVSPFLMEFSRYGKKKEYIRMFTGSGFYVGINENYYSIALENGFTSFESCGNGSRAAITAESWENKMIVLPINMNQEAIKEFVNVL